MNTINLDEIFVKHADRTGVPWQLIKAVSQQESNLNPKAVKTMDKTGMRAIGLMQVTCPSKKIIEGWIGEEPAEGGCDSLFDPDKNVQMGTDILSWNMTFFGFLRGIASFNIWTECTSSPQGPFKNQAYVDAIIKNFKQYGGDFAAANAQYGEGKRGGS